MANVDLRNFVDINIGWHTKALVSSSRPITVLFTAEGTTGSEIEINNYDEISTKLSSSAYTNTIKYAKVYFANNGKTLIVKPGYSTVVLADIAALSDDRIIVAYCPATGTSMTTLSAIETSSLVGIHKKVLITRTETLAASTKQTSDIAVKYSKVIGGEMTICAYLSQIDVYKSSSIQDYAFTTEYGYDTISIAETNDNSTLEDSLKYNMNVDMMISSDNIVRNFGGNMYNLTGIDLVNNFVLIILQQTLTYRLFELLTSKIKGEKGVSAIQSAIVQELNKYVISGYLTTDKLWSDQTWSENYNGVDYTIISKDSPITLGYTVTVVPYSGITEEDKLAHKTPPIYIVLATADGIRKIVIEGDAI